VGSSPLPEWRPEDWRDLEEWLWAVDLFNEEYWWESHEALEALWHAAGRTAAPARFVQSLVHLSAACLNRRRGHIEAARRQAGRTVRGLREAAAATASEALGSSGLVVMGIDVDRLVGDVERSFGDDDARPIRIDLAVEEP
jgi:predicted metal-dependent hydrolase